MEDIDIKLKDFCEENEYRRQDVDRVIDELGIKKYRCGQAFCITRDNALIVSRELDLPEQLQPELRQARYIHDARNRSRVYAKIEGLPNKHPILIPRKLYGKLAGKRFKVEKIEDNTGVTWRHEWFRKLESTK